MSDPNGPVDPFKLFSRVQSINGEDAPSQGLEIDLTDAADVAHTEKAESPPKRSPN